MSTNLKISLRDVKNWIFLFLPQKKGDFIWISPCFLPCRVDVERSIYIINGPSAQVDGLNSPRRKHTESGTQRPLPRRDCKTANEKRPSDESLEEKEMCRGQWRMK